MKHTLLLGGLLFTSILANAQRLSLYEEFSGENCGPCAAANPGLNTILNANPTKVVLLKYQSPIPSAGPIYNQNTADVDSRTAYYSVPFAPYGRMDGAVLGTGQNAGHVSFCTQAAIDAAAAVPTNFSLAVTNTITNGTNIVTNVTITSNAAYNNANLKLRVALVEDLYFTTPPGTNGETEFHHVMRKMLANPINVQSTWTAGGTQTLSTASITIPTYVNRTNNVFVIAWIQDESNKNVLQAGKSAAVPGAAFDAMPLIVTPSNGSMFCAGNVEHKVKVKNTGTSPISGTVSSKQNGVAFGTPQSFGPIQPGQLSADLTIGTITQTGAVSVEDIVTLTGTADQNPANDAATTSISVLTTPGTLPQSTSFEAATPPAGYIVLDNEGAAVAAPTVQGPTWFTFSGSGIVAKDGTFAAMADCGTGIEAGKSSIITFPYVAPPTGAKAVDFYYAYAQRGTIAGDKLEVVYSTDCGQNWTSIWSKSGADLATASPTGSQSLFIPSSADQYKFASVDATAANGNVIMGFRSTSNGGNIMYIDNVKYRAGTPTGIEELIAGGNFSVYPNPTTGLLNVELTMIKKSNVTISVYNIMGQRVKVPVTQSMAAGTNITTINTSDLATGMYYLNIATEAGNIQQKFTKQ